MWWRPPDHWAFDLPAAVAAQAAAAGLRQILRSSSAISAVPAVSADRFADSLPTERRSAAAVFAVTREPWHISSSAMAKLTITEAARLLGKSPRTVRDMARTGKIPAERNGGRWAIDAAELSKHSSARASRTAAVEQVRHHVNAALDQVSPEPPTGPTRRFYSLRDLRCHRLALEMERDLLRMEGLEPKDVASVRDALRRFQHQLAEGFHQFHPELKVACFVAARRTACSVLADLLRMEVQHPGRAIEVLTERLEREVLGSLRGLLRTAERRARKASS